MTSPEPPLAAYILTLPLASGCSVVAVCPAESVSFVVGATVPTVLLLTEKLTVASSAVGIVSAVRSSVFEALASSVHSVSEHDVVPGSPLGSNHSVLYAPSAPPVPVPPSGGVNAGSSSNPTTAQETR